MHQLNRGIVMKKSLFKIFCLTSLVLLFSACSQKSSMDNTTMVSKPILIIEQNNHIHSKALAVDGY